MADDIAVTPGAGATVAADEISSVKYQRIKLIHGADGVNAGDVSTANGLPVQFVAGSGVTANAGTNLNTSALALESGGNLAAIAASASVLDDWDETDRAKVNPIVGQAGVDGGSGVVSSATQRVCLATNVALPAGTNGIGKLTANSGVDIGDVDVTSVPTDPFGANADASSATGSISAKLRFIASTGIPITGTVTVASHAVTNAGTFAVQPAGSVADDATTPPNPVMIGGSAVETDGTDPTSVSAEDDVSRVRTDRNRRLLVNTAHPNLWNANDNQSSAQTNTVLKTAPGANLSLYITDIAASNGATAGDIRFVEDPAGTPAIKIPKLYLGVNAGTKMIFSTPIRITANKAFGYTSTTVTTHSVLVSGYIAP